MLKLGRWAECEQTIQSALRIPSMEQISALCNVREFPRTAACTVAGGHMECGEWRWERCVRCGLSVIGGLVVTLLTPALAPAQGVPVPLPTEPGGGRPPVYTQPGPTPFPVESEPVRPMAPAGSPPTEPAVSGGNPGVGKASEAAEGTSPRATEPQWTTFPELTRGIGNSETLLKE
jgi:hypothetical protein